MEWTVEFTDEFEHWWDSLSEEEQDQIDAKVELLEEHGPSLPGPHADTIVSSRHRNMREWRGKCKGRQLRILYACDPRRAAILLMVETRQETRTGTLGTLRLRMIYLICT
jgi:hypothetical protein